MDTVTTIIHKFTLVATRLSLRRGSRMRWREISILHPMKTWWWWISQERAMLISLTRARSWPWARRSSMILTSRESHLIKTITRAISTCCRWLRTPLSLSRVIISRPSSGWPIREWMAIAKSSTARWWWNSTQVRKRTWTCKQEEIWIKVLCCLRTSQIIRLKSWTTVETQWWSSIWI